MKTLVLVLALGCSCIVAAPAFAEQNPAASPEDFRIKHVNYDPNNVVRLDAVIGIATHIIVAPGETYVTHAFGDPNGWDFAHVGNNYFIKAKAANSDTNLVIVTDKHSYNFILHYVGNYDTKGPNGQVIVHDIKTPWTMRQATLQVQFDYPREIARERAAAAEKASLASRFDVHGGYHNLDYAMSATPKDEGIEPVNVWDDGRFTYFKFAPNAELPNVYVIGSDGKETLVNRYMLPDDGGQHVIVAERIARRFVLRLGDEVVGIINQHYNPIGTPNSTGTSSPVVHRVIKGGEQ
ncbi:MAG: TrbG/VirB9 family P-type conjugative transfer protein [Acidiphilium sp.]|nr:TrbG/VirB9 family P-type conjugative transfer protein [Acidiphilium sp.]